MTHASLPVKTRRGGRVHGSENVLPAAGNFPASLAVLSATGGGSSPLSTQSPPPYAVRYLRTSWMSRPRRNERLRGAAPFFAPDAVQWYVSSSTARSTSTPLAV